MLVTVLTVHVCGITDVCIGTCEPALDSQGEIVGTAYFAVKIGTVTTDLTSLIAGHAFVLSAVSIVTIWTNLETK